MTKFEIARRGLLTYSQVTKDALQRLRLRCCAAGCPGIRGSNQSAMKL